ncbi:MAG TPA: protein-L-isoaspartate(D-aspartate) O-methyltransferase [Anaerolineales bacterium]|nr:protein-L-isoaspartate(D-aspartate) O-methyltransferase [Anaerolineales bacterium]
MVQIDAFWQLRERMVDEQLGGRDISDRRVLEAMRSVPRHRFVPQEAAELAYIDAPLPIGFRQTISQPYIVALMTQMLRLHGDEIILEVGTGSGYQAAVLGRLARRVHTVERIPELAETARRVLAEVGAENVEVHIADGSTGLPEEAPFDAILVAAAAPRAPRPLLEQLAEAGRLVVPVGTIEGQILERWIRRGNDFTCDRSAPVCFVPLLGSFGWEQDERPDRGA